MTASRTEHAEESRKELDALLRAVPVARMVDYGVPRPLAAAVHAAVQGGDPPAWDRACESLAREQAGSAAQPGQAPHGAAAAWRSASALLQCAQLAFHADTPRKRALYADAHAAMVHHARLSRDLTELALPTPQGLLHGWLVRPAGPPAGQAVVIFGGLSGWGSVYLDMARALAARGMLAILAEGPGQGSTRLRSGLHLDAQTLPLFGAFVAHARTLGATRIGVWGNSFGGLFAAHVAAADASVAAVCINGAPMAPQVPAFRTAREQLAALFGTGEGHALAQRVAALALHPDRDRIEASMLVLQGGCDPLVPLGEQEAFFRLAASGRTQLLTWPDGEHTIYNHAAERNARVADWFAAQFAA